MKEFLHDRFRKSFVSCGTEKDERIKTLVQIIEGLKGAIDRAREAGLVDLVFQLTAVLSEAERELALLTQLNRPGRMAAMARRRYRAALRRHGR